MNLMSAPAADTSVVHRLSWLNCKKFFIWEVPLPEELQRAAPGVSYSSTTEN